MLLLPWATPLQAQGPEPSAQEKEIDQQHLQQIYQAIQAYRKDRGDLPKWLSDLVPHYLPDPTVLMSPFEERTGRSALFGYVDPKARTSYIYEFGGNPAGGAINQGRDRPLSMKEWKTLQMEEFGPAVPILRCHLYSPVLNIAFAGEFYETGLFWETDANTLVLAKRLGLGPGSKEEKWITVKAVDDTGNPLADVEVTAANRRSTLGPLPPRTVKTDTQGQCRVPLGWGDPQTLSLDFAKVDYAATPMSWNESTAQNLPDEITAKLQPAALIGGIVRSPDGKPIAGATVTVSGVIRDEVGQSLLASYDTVKTDAEGRWSSRRVPKDFEGLNFKLTRSEFLPAEYDQAERDSPGQNHVAKPDLLAARSPMVMEPAIHIEGTVSQGTQPIAGARVLLRNTSDSPTNQVQRTDTQGHFSFVVLEEGTFELAVEADHASPVLQHLSVKSGFKPLAMSLQPAKTIRGIVTDENEQPLQKAEVSVAAWQDQPILGWRTTTDTQGLFTWDGAPDDTVTLSVSKPGYNGMAKPVAPDTTQPVPFQLSKSFRLSGTVVDADTGAPIKTFRLLRGSLWDPGNTNQVNWERGSETLGSEGRYSINGLQPYFGGMGRVKFMLLADGYLPQATPALSASGWHTQDFELHKGQGPHGIVKLPGGGPVAGAEVALLGMGYLSLGKGTFRTVGGNNDSFVAHTDTNGAFTLPAALPSPTIVSVHAEGFAEVTGDQLATNTTVVLEPWGKVEGTLWLTHDVGTNEDVMIADGTGTGVSGINFDWSIFKTTTDDQGRFSFPLVPPGKRQVVRLIPQGGRSWMWADQTPVTVIPAQTTNVTIGGSGCRLIARLVASDPTQKIDWESGRFSLHTEFPRPPTQFKSRQEAEEWNNSPAARAAREQYRHYPVTVRSEGSLRVDNVPTGKYTLDLAFTKPQEDRPGMGQTLGRISKEITLPDKSADPAQALLDLGTLEVKLAASLSPGKPAPEIQGKDVEGATFKLSEYRGKVVLIDFWGDW
jgi:uncharacterized GH25 family protein